MFVKKFVSPRFHMLLMLFEVDYYIEMLVYMFHFCATNGLDKDICGKIKKLPKR